MIKIEVKKSNKCNGDNSLFISFPYNQKVVNILREQIIRYWLPESKEWEVPIKAFPKLVQEFKNNDLSFDIIDEDKILLQKSKAMLIPSNYQFKINPFNHQIEGIEYGLKYDRFLLGDEQGLGKTMQVINIACIKKQQKNYRHCLIVCGVNGLKWNWKAEVEKHSNESAYILGTRYDKKGKIKIGSVNDRIDDLDLLLKEYDIEKDDDYGLFDYNPMLNSYFLITNIETLRNEKIIEKLKVICEKGIINMIALDEGHKCFHYDTLITTNKGSLKIGDIVENKIDCNILSYNHTTKKYEFKKIKNHFKNNVQEELIELEILGEDNKIHKIKCTKNHNIYTENRGYVEAALLKETDIILIND